MSAQVAKVEKEDWKEIMMFNWKEFEDEDLKRKFKISSDLGESALPEDKYMKVKHFLCNACIANLFVLEIK